MIAIVTYFTNVREWAYPLYAPPLLFAGSLFMSIAECLYASPR